MSRSRIRNISMEVAVGVFIFLIMLALGIFTIFLSEEKIFKPSYELQVLFDEVMGLREGENVVLRGVDIGNVRKLEVTPEGVLMTASLQRPVTLYENYSVTIKSTSVLGGRHVQIDQGAPDLPEVSADKVLRGEDPTDLMSEASRIFTMLNGALDEGGLLENLQVAVDELRQTAEGLNRGEGTLGRLLTDDSLYEDIHALAGSLRSVSERLERGEGALGKLLADDEIYDNLRGISADFRDISRRLERGEGTLGRLLSADDTLHSDMQEAMASLRKVAAAIERGEGTLGKIVMDDELYAEIEALVGEARAAIHDFRDASPITTFSSIFFGAF